MRRGQWVEFESDDPDEMIMVHPGWTNDTESLVLAVRETGWFATSSAVYTTVEDAKLSWGFLGEDDEGELHPCNAQGFRGLDDDEEPLSEVSSATFARLGSFRLLAPRVPRNRDW